MVSIAWLFACSLSVPKLLHTRLPCLDTYSRYTYTSFSPSNDFTYICGCTNNFEALRLRFMLYSSSRFPCASPEEAWLIPLDTVFKRLEEQGPSYPGIDVSCVFDSGDYLSETSDVQGVDRVHSDGGDEG